MLKSVNINMHFDNKRLFDDDISLDIVPNELIILSGTNGGGKSSVMEMLALLQLPSTGAVYWEDQIIDSMKEANRLRAKLITLLMSEIRMIRQLNIKENIVLPANLQGFKEYRDRIDYLVEDVLDLSHSSNPALSLKHLIDKENVCKLSDGEKRIVAIARSLIMKTPYFFADELLNGFTEEMKGEVLERLLAHFKKEGTGVFVIEHWARLKDTAVASGMKVHSLKVENRKLIKE